jgi:hypothetical protein
MRREGFVGECIEFPGARVPLNGFIEPVGLEQLEPRTKAFQLARVQLLDCLLDFFGGRHMGNIASMKHDEKANECAQAFTPFRSPGAARR